MRAITGFLFFFFLVEHSVQFEGQTDCKWMHLAVMWPSAQPGHKLKHEDV